MKIQAGLDWLQYTSHDKINPALPPYIFTNDAKSIHPLNGYEFGRQHKYGARVYIAPRRPDMGENVILSGETLELLRRDDMCSFAIMDEVVKMGHKVGRIDVSIDIFDTDIVTPRKAFYWHKMDLCNTRVKGRRYVDGQDTDGIEGDTLYIGTKKSKSGFVRIYDKKAEQKRTDIEHWTRVEAQFKSRKAHSVAKKLWSSPENRYTMALALVNGFVSFDTTSWYSVFSENKVKARDMRTKTDSDKRRDWLLTDVASAIANEIENSPHILSEIEREVMIKVMEKNDY